MSFKVKGYFRVNNLFAQIQKKKVFQLSLVEIIKTENINMTKLKQACKLTLWFAIKIFIQLYFTDQYLRDQIPVVNKSK